MVEVSVGGVVVEWKLPFDCVLSGGTRFTVRSENRTAVPQSTFNSRLTAFSVAVHGSRFAVKKPTDRSLFTVTDNAVPRQCNRERSPTVHRQQPFDSVVSGGPRYTVRSEKPTDRSLLTVTDNAVPRQCNRKRSPTVHRPPTTTAKPSAKVFCETDCTRRALNAGAFHVCITYCPRLPAPRGMSCVATRLHAVARKFAGGVVPARMRRSGGAFEARAGAAG